MEKSIERQFLHDVSNPAAVCHGHLKIIQKKLEQDELDKQDLFQRITKALEALERINDVISKKRDELTS